MTNKLYVGNLSFNTAEENLKTTFSKFGNVVSCKLIKDRDTGRSKGFAFVEMSTEDEAQEAISALDGKELDGRNIKVNESKPQEDKPRSFGGGNKGGFRR